MRGNIVETNVKASNCESLEAIIGQAVKYGYSHVVVPYSLSQCFDKGDSVKGARLIYRIEFDAQSPNEVKRAVKKANTIKKEFTRKDAITVVALKPTNLQALRSMPHLHGFEIIVLTPQLSRYMDRSQAKLLAARNDVLIDLPLPSYLSNRRSLHQLYVTIRKMIGYDVLFVMSSNAEEPVKLWSPAMKLGLLLLLGVPHGLAGVPVYTYPARLLRILAHRNSR